MPPNRQPELWAAALIPYTAATVALVLRMVARRKTRVLLVWEDYLAIVAFLIGSGFTFISLYKLRWGLGMHLEDIDMPMDQIVHDYFMDLFVDMWFYTFSVGLSKFVILGFYWRMFSTSLIRQPIRILFACSVAWIVVRVTLICMQCQPLEKFWNKDVPGVCRLTPMISLFGAGIPHFILEVVILFCPLIEIWRLHLSTTKKLAVAAMFMSGIFVCCSALGTIIHTVALAKKINQDLTWDGLDDQIWAVCDVNLASFATSLPLLRPIFRSFGGVFSGLKSTQSPFRSYGISQGTPTYGSGPARRSRNAKHSDSDSVIEFADAGDHIAGTVPNASSSKAYALHDVGSRDSDVEAQSTDGIHVHSETIIDFGKAS